MRETPPELYETLARLSPSLALTRAGQLAESLVRAFWPLWSILIAVAGALLLGLHDLVAVETVWAVSGVAGLGLLWAIYRGIQLFRWPRRDEAIDRLDRSLPGRPISALADVQAIGAGDAASARVWQAHLKRMAARAQGARAVRPDLTLASRDRFALRYVALTLFAVALLFGSYLRVGSVTGMAPGTGTGVATGPSWEGWIEPPSYTGLPTLYLADIDGESIRVAAGARLSLRFYGGADSIVLTDQVSEDVSQTSGPAMQTREGTITRSGQLSIGGPGGRSWSVVVLPDTAPEVILSAEMHVRRGGEMEQAFYASDDHGVTSGQARIALDMPRVDRRYGLAPAPEPREAIVVDLPMTISGDRAGFEETLVETFARHPWAGLPVTLQLTVEDAIAQRGHSAASAIVLPARRFFDPLAAAVIEQRRDILWSRDNGPRAARLIRAVTYFPEGFIKNEKGYLLLRVALKRLEAGLTSETGLTAATQDEVADMLWEAALLFEEGDLSSAEARLQQAQDKLSEAMRNGASDDEIAELMQELRDAMRDYIRELAEQNQRDGHPQTADNQNMMQMDTDQLQQMLDRLQELMQQGRMAEAQQLMEMLRQMMENMQVTQGGPGQQSPGEQAMNDLAETLRDQQGLSDEAFRDLQEQFNPDAQAGESQQNRGRDGGQGQGQVHNQGEGQQGQGEGQGQQGRDPSQQGQGQADQQGSPQEGRGTNQGPGDLATRQGQLRDRLNQLERNLPGAGTEQGEAARDALGRAGEAMDEAEDALREGDMAQALDNQAEAMEAMREGLRELGNALAEQRQQGGQQGTANGDPGGASRDPLGRQAGNQGRLGSDEELAPGEDIYRRARDLLDEIRRRSSDQERPAQELDYLNRLLDRF